MALDNRQQFHCPSPILPIMYSSKMSPLVENNLTKLRVDSSETWFVEEQGQAVSTAHLTGHLVGPHMLFCMTTGE